jgi:hypothetical protein
MNMGQCDLAKEVYMKSKGKERPLDQARMREFLMPVKLPGINYDTFEEELDKEEEFYGTDRAHLYHPTFAMEHPGHFAHRYNHRIRDQLTRGYHIGLQSRKSNSTHVNIDEWCGL